MKTRGPMFLLGLSLALLGAGLWRLFDLRFAAGDVYPSGSTLRADAEGTRAYFDSLGLLSGRTVSRGLLPLASLHGSPGAAVFLLAVDPSEAWVHSRDREALHNLLANGTRLIIAFQSSRASTSEATNRMAIAPLGSGRYAGQQTLTEALNLPPWIATPGTNTLSENTGALRTSTAPSYLPTRIPWRGGAFESPANGWTSLFTLAESPVILERPYGRGTIVLLADMSLLTNEALRHGRQPALLAWLAGPATQLIFDETHLGTGLDPGIMTLVRRYGLTGFLAALLVVAGLALWRSANGLVPRRTEESLDSRVVVTGRDATAGFIQLLTRSVPPTELLPLCLSEWRRTLPGNRPDLLSKAAALQDVVNLEAHQSPRKQNPAQTYRRLVELLSRP